MTTTFDSAAIADFGDYLGAEAFESIGRIGMSGTIGSFVCTEGMSKAGFGDSPSLLAPLGDIVSGDAADLVSEPAPLPNADQLKRMVTGYAMTPEWRVVTERIDRGTLTWDEVLTSLRSGKADAEVVAAFQSLATVPPPTPEQMAALGLGPAPDDQPVDPPEERRIPPLIGGLWIGGLCVKPPLMA